MATKVRRYDAVKKNKKLIDNASRRRSDRSEQRWKNSVKLHPERMRRRRTVSAPRLARLF
jgi:hypothetical protein